MENEAILFGALGGMLPDIMRIIENRYSNKFPDYISKPAFWAGFALLIAIGALIAGISKPEGIEQSLALGYAAPKIISELAGKLPGNTQSQSNANANQEESTVNQNEDLIKLNKKDIRKDFRLLEWWKQ